MDTSLEMRPSNTKVLSLSCLFHTGGDRLNVNKIGREKLYYQILSVTKNRNLTVNIVAIFVVPPLHGLPHSNTSSTRISTPCFYPSRLLCNHRAFGFYRVLISGCRKPALLTYCCSFFALLPLVYSCELLQVYFMKNPGACRSSGLCAPSFDSYTGE